MKLIIKSSIALFLLLLCFSCSNDDQILEDNPTSFETKARPIIGLPDNTGCGIANNQLRDFFGYTSYPGGNPNVIDGIVDTYFNSVYNWTAVGIGRNTICKENIFHLNSSGDFSTYDVSDSFESWRRPKRGELQFALPVGAIDPLIDCIISDQERNDLVDRVIIALDTIPNHFNVTDVDIQASYSTSSSTVEIKVVVTTIHCYERFEEF